MKALIIYVVFVIIGAVVASGIGYWIEKEFSATLSLIVFLAMFFANFGVSWLAVVYGDGRLAQGHPGPPVRSPTSSAPAGPRLTGPA